MFGLGMAEIILIAVVALLVLGPDRLPNAAKTLGKGIRDLKRQTRDLQHSIEADSELGSAVREIKSAFRDDPELHRDEPPSDAEDSESEPLVKPHPDAVPRVDDDIDEAIRAANRAYGVNQPVESKAPSAETDLSKADAPKSDD
jgi:sec-independent protein translocase protein TatB